MFTKYGHQLKTEELDYTAFQRTTIIPNPEESVFLQQRQQTERNEYNARIENLREDRKWKLEAILDHFGLSKTGNRNVLAERLQEHEQILSETEMDEILNRDE